MFTMTRPMSLAEDIAPLDVDYVQMYKLVLSFKDTLSKLFSETGMGAESSRLRDFQTLSVEAHREHCPSPQLLSSNVHLVFQLIVELIQAILVSKSRESRAVQKEEKATQTEDGTAAAATAAAAAAAAEPSRKTTTNAAAVKQEKPNENSDDSDDHNPTLTPTLPEPPPPSVPLRKSRRTSVLNRKPFVTPRQTRRKINPPSKEPVTTPTRTTTKPSTKPPSVSKPHTRSSTQPTGSQKRKIGAMRKKSLLAKAAKKTVKEAAVSEAQRETVKEEDDDEDDEEEEEEEVEEVENRPRRGRRSVLATTMYERTAEGTFRCRECGKVAKLQTNIRKHLRKHTGEKPYRCSLCPVAFAYPRSLKRHQLVHEGVRPYQCPECSKRFFDPTSLRTHSRVHTNDRPFVCQVCGDRFRQKEGLKGHMRRHTGDRPYVCEHCGMAFAAKRSLTRHIRVHTGERPYSCDQCVAAFADWTTLHNHKLVHRSPGWGEGEGQDDNGDDKEGRGSENRPFQCQFCGVRYRQPLSLKRHLRLHSANPAPKKPAVKRPPKRRMEDGGEVGVAGGAEEEPVALHLHYRPYACDLCGAKFKHLRGFETHKSKHESGTLTAKKLPPAKRLKQEGGINPADIKQAASILASVAVNSTAIPNDIIGNAAALTNNIARHHDDATLSSTRIALGTADSSDIVSAPHHTTHTISLPHSTPLPHTITIAHNTGHGIATIPSCSSSSSSIPNSSTPLSVSLLPPAPQPADASTVTIIDAATFSTITNNDAPTLHLPVSSAAMLGESGDMIQYASGNVTQVVQYPDGTLSEVTTLVPHHPHHHHHAPPPPPSSMLPTTVDLLENVVTVVFETRDGSVVLENQ